MLNGVSNGPCGGRMCEGDGMERRPALLECIGTSEGVPTNSMRRVVNNLVKDRDFGGIDGLLNLCWQIVS